MLQQRSIAATALAAAALASSSTSAQADVLLVPSRYATIQAAMDAAQEGDTVLVADGVYTGAGNTFLSFHGRGFLVRSENGPASCIIDCGGTFVDNSASTEAAAVWIGTSGLVTLRSSTFARNVATQRGGAIFVRRGRPQVRGCTFADNGAGSFGGALACIGPSSVELADSIFWSDAAPSGPELALLTDLNLGGAELSVRYSDVQGGQAAILVQPGSALAYGPGNLDLDPLFVDAPNGDYHIDLASPARDAGDPAALPLPSKLDIDGEPRFAPPRIDMGSDEVHALRAAR